MSIWNKRSWLNAERQELPSGSVPYYARPENVQAYRNECLASAKLRVTSKAISTIETVRTSGCQNRRTCRSKTNQPISIVMPA